LLPQRPHLVQRPVSGKLCFCSLDPRNRPFAIKGKGWAGLPVRCCRAGCRNVPHCTPVPYNCHCCEHRLPSHMVEDAALWRPCRLPSKNTELLVSIQHGDSYQLGLTSFSTNTILSLAQTLHRDRRRGTRATDGLWSASIRNTGSPPSNVVPSRLPWPLSAPLSRTLLLGPLLNPMLRPQYEAQFPSSKKFSAVLQTVHVAIWVVLLLFPYRYFHLFTAPVPRHIVPSSSALRLHPAQAAPF
jgi:hypothetical protein